MKIDPNPIMPKFYYSRLKESDRSWIRTRMARIPRLKQQDIAAEYERIFLTEKSFARKKANTWLNGIAKEYIEAK